MIQTEAWYTKLVKRGVIIGTNQDEYMLCMNKWECGWYLVMYNNMWFLVSLKGWHEDEWTCICEFILLKYIICLIVILS